jgi:hypothetical protein
VHNTTVTASSPGGANVPWKVEHQMVKQTDTAYKLTLTVTPASKGGNFSITGLLATVGLKRGGAKLPNAQRG